MFEFEFAPVGPIGEISPRTFEDQLSNGRVRCSPGNREISREENRCDVDGLENSVNYRQR